MKALTISQPFATLIATGEKWVENRTWETLYTGWLAIHAGKGTQYLDRDELQAYPTGCIIAVARIVACVHIDAIHDSCQRDDIVLGTRRTWQEIATHEHTEGPWCWVLQDVRTVDHVPINGMQGLWRVPDEIVAKLKGGAP